MSAEVADVLDKAAEEVAKGWTRGKLERDGRCCAVGAIDRVTVGASNVNTLALDALVHVINTFAVGDWNDAQPSKKPVIAALRAAAARERAS